jgi:two-component system, OmpR family, response regulator MprA
VLPSAVIYDRVWGADDGVGSDSLRVYVGYLRRKLEVGGMPRMIQTVHGIGYVLREPERALSSPTDRPRRAARR